MQKKWTPSLTYFWDIVKILQTGYFEDFENAWSCPSINNDSIAL